MAGEKILSMDSGGLVTELTAAQARSLLNVEEGAISLGSVANLRVKNNSTYPDYQVDIDADSITVRSASAVKQIFDVNLTVDITQSGANGLDTGSEASSTNYYIFVIYNPTTETVAGLLSVSYSSPTLPSGYTYSYLYGMVRNDSSGNFIPFSQINEESWYNARQQVDGLDSTTYDTIDISTYIPSATGKVKSALFGAIAEPSAANFYIWIGTDGVNAKTVFYGQGVQEDVGEYNELYHCLSASPVFVPIVGNNIYYKVSVTGKILLVRAYRWSHIH